MNDKKQILKIRCSDGLTTKPNAIRGNFIHEIRLPGGVLFPDLWSHSNCQCEQTSGAGMDVLRFSIEKMMDFKMPTEIVLMAHAPCGAALATGMSHDHVLEAHRQWQKKLQSWYPTIPVTVYVEKHSPCGEFREGHEQLPEEVV